MLMESIIAQGVAVPAAWTGPPGVALIGGDTNVVRSFRDPYKAWTIGISGRLQTAAEQIRARSTDWHDNVDGITCALPAVAGVPVDNVFPCYQRQPLRSQTVINMEIFGSATAGDIDSIMVTNYYENTGDLTARLINEETLDRIAVKGHIQTCQAAIVAGVAGGYSGATALAAFAVGAGQWKANKDYALLGYAVSASIVSVGIRGADTGQVRIGMPGNQVQRHYTCNYFVRLARESGLPTIPVFNAANQGNVIIDLANDENALTPIVTLYFQLLDTIVAMQS